MPKNYYNPAIQERKDLQLESQPTEFRRCLSCDEWMYSTGPDHRRCNVCKGGHYAKASKVGARVEAGSRKKRRRVECWAIGNDWLKTGSKKS